MRAGFAKWYGLLSCLRAAADISGGRFAALSVAPEKQQQLSGSHFAVLGICSILSCLLLLIDSVGGFFCFNSIPLGAAGVALGIIARGEIRSRDPRGSTALATGGMVCSIIGLCIGVLLVLLSIATLAVLIRLLFSYI